MTPKQQRFVQEYLIDCNATQAAIRAGYSANGAEVQGHRLLSNAKIADVIAKEQKESAEKAGITRERILNGLLKEAEYYGEGATHGARVSAWTGLGKLTEGEKHSVTVLVRRIGGD